MLPSHSAGRDKSFNPRTHTGYDVPGGSHRHFPRVSIHAPTRGTTLIVKQTTKLKVYVSIHAPTRGTTSGADKSIDIIGSFNPRTHTGYDRQTLNISGLTRIVSIHAPTRGTTNLLERHTEGVDVSIHAPTRGTTQPVTYGYQIQREFQSTHPHGVRPS